MKELDRTGVFGLGPGSIEPIHKLDNAQILFKEPKGPRSVYTTSIGHENLFDRHVPPEFLQPMSSLRILTANGTDFTVPTGDNYYMVDYQNLISFWKKQLLDEKKPFEIIPDTVKNEDITVQENDGLVKVGIEGGYYEFESVVDATGIEAVVSTKVEKNRKNEDFIVEYVCLGTYPGVARESELSLAFGPGGGTSWANPSTEKGPNGEPVVDIAFSGWGRKSQFERLKNGEGRMRLDMLKDWIKEKEGFELHDDNPFEVSYGMIRSQKIPLPESDAVYPVGESAGAAKPLTGESFNRAMFSGMLATNAIEQDMSPHDYVLQLQKKYKGGDIFFALTKLKLERQLRGENGITMDALHRIFNQENISPSFVKSMEDFVIKGRLSPKLVFCLLKEPFYRDYILRVAAYTSSLKLLGPERQKFPEWSFPEI